MILSDMMGNDPKLASLFNQAEFSLIPGGLPLNVDGATVGGFGVSGGHYRMDEEVAVAALAP
jgi:uncharacterized protein GlcG (DUF336 family)